MRRPFLSGRATGAGGNGNLRGSGTSYSGRAGTLAPEGGRGSSGGNDHIANENIPDWDGRPFTLEDFEEEVSLWTAGVDDKMLPLLGPRIARAHGKGTKQRSVAMALTLEQLRTADGPEKIDHQGFQEQLGRQASG